MAIRLDDPEAFRAAFAAHERSVYTTAYRILGDATQAQDVVQDVFLRLWRRPRAFDPERGELGGYLRLMARSRALDVWREGQAAGRAGDRLRDAVGDAGDPGADERPERVAERDAVAAAVREALDGLPETQREALVLAYWGGLTTDEIARRAAIPLGTAKSRIRLALGHLRAESGDALAAVA